MSLKFSSETEIASEMVFVKVRALRVVGSLKDLWQIATRKLQCPSVSEELRQKSSTLLRSLKMSLKKGIQLSRQPSKQDFAENRGHPRWLFRLEASDSVVLPLHAHQGGHATSRFLEGFSEGSLKEVLLGRVLTRRLARVLAGAEVLSLIEGFLEEWVS